MTTYYFVAASQRFLLEEEPFDEVLQERYRRYQSEEREVDFWLIKQPAFLAAPSLAAVRAKCPKPSAAVVSTDKTFITWLKLRLEYVAVGEFEAPTDEIPDPLASMEAAA